MPLPIEAVLPELKSALQERHEAVLVAEPGAGKTTLVPLSLLDEAWLKGRQILMLEPRRLAAKTAAQRMAQLLNERVGETVGYRMRLDRKESANTRILVVTEGVLTRMLQSDPSLDGIGLLIFDEFHERSVDADLGLALSLYGRQLFRDDQQALKILLMSATLDSEAAAHLLDKAPVVSSEGRSFPVDIRYGQRPGLRELPDAVAEQVCASLQRDAGSLLVFLPGQGEIRRVLEKLQQRIGHDESIILAPLYGDLSLEQQQLAIAPAADGKRKIVLATSIAESSITIDGVRVVIDCGYSRVPQFDPRTGMTRLHTQRISRASADQRAGRAGRLEPGIAYRLWSEEQQGQLAAFAEPEIRQSDLAPLALQLLHWGVSVDELRWLDPPAAAPWQQAQDLLVILGACDSEGKITAHGEAMAALPVHPRLAHMLLRSQDWNLSELACELAAVLSDRDPLRDVGADVVARLELLEEGRGRHRSGPAQRLRQQAQRFRQQLGEHRKKMEREDDRDRAGLLLALAYPDRLARQRSPGSDYYQLANGRSARLQEDDPLRQQPWLAVAQLGGLQQQSSDRIFMAAALDVEWLTNELSDCVQQTEVLEWQNQGQQLVAERQWRVGKLIWRREPLQQLDDDLRKKAVLDWVRARGLEVLPWNEDLRQWQARVLCLREADLEQSGESTWPDISDAWLADHLDQWLLPFVPALSHIRQLQQLDLSSALHSLLSWPLPQQLDEQAPSHYRVPTGSRIRIDYRQQPPVLAVKLQEMFGQSTTPCIANGRVALMLHLLSPARRPLQVTQDLESFWQNAYRDVQKDMKGRYPKHPWPDDPARAVPQRGTKKQGVRDQ